MLNQNTLVSPVLPVGTCHPSGEVAQVVDEFRVGSGCYQVIVSNATELDASLEKILKALFANSEVENLAEITRFIVGGQLCLIVAAKESTQPPESDEIQSLLTERELQIAVLVALGKVNKQIAKQLHISEWTVATYLRRMFAKLRVDSRAALIYRCAPLIRRIQQKNADAATHFNDFKETASYYSNPI
jgi:DNA-binding NarL/FixJ family response regulator